MTARTLVLAVAAAWLIPLGGVAHSKPATSPPASADNASVPPFVPNLRPLLHVSPAAGPITIDGKLDDPGWRHAARATNFSESSPGDQTRPPVATQVLVTYDHTHLYLAFIADDDPRSIRATLRARDEIFNDDYVGIVIDTYGNGAWAYELCANPLGLQGDMRWTPDEEDIGFDVVFSSKGRITDHGYQVEMSVPFKSLRFPARDEQRWRVTFVRSHPRDSLRRYTWAALDRDDPCYPCQFGTLTGIEGVRPGGSLEVLPAMTGSRSATLADPTDPRAGFADPTGRFDLSLGARYGFGPSVGASVAINPDFSQVESDAAQVEVNTTFALFYPEKRPFFMEGSDLYKMPYEAVYTRSINDPSVAGKLTGRSDRTSFFVLAARDEHTPLIVPLEERSVFVAAGKSFSTIARVQRSFGEDDAVGAVVTDRRYDKGGSGTVAGVDARVRLGQQYQVSAQGLVSLTDEMNAPTLAPVDSSETFARGEHTVALDGERYGGHGAYVKVARDARHWKTGLEYWDSSPTFRADNGFVTGNSRRLLEWSNAWIAYPDNRVIDWVRLNVNATRRWNAYSVRKAVIHEHWVDVQLKKQTLLSLGYDYNEERFHGVYMSGIDLFYGELSTEFSDPVHAGIWMGVGDRVARTDSPFVGTGRHIDLWGQFKLWKRLVIEPTFAISKLAIKKSDLGLSPEVLAARRAGEFNAWIGRVRINYQFTRELFLRLVLQYDDFDGTYDVEPLLSYELNPFSVFYLGAGLGGRNFDHASIDPMDRTGDGFEPTDWQAFFKFQYFYRL